MSIHTEPAAAAVGNAKVEHAAAAVAAGLASFDASVEGEKATSSSSSSSSTTSSDSDTKTTTTKTTTTTSTPPVVVALANRFYFGERYARVVPGCTWRGGASLPCEFTNDQARLADADAIA